MTKKVSELIYDMDIICRENFEKGFIVSERDYVSLFLSFIKYPYGPFSARIIAHSQTLPSKIEQKHGCDGIIIFKKGEKYRIGLFEAKVIKKGFDSFVGKPRVSRFQRQIEKQKGINPKVLVWEMFFNNNEKNIIYDKKGSTCVRSNIAFAHKAKRTMWNLIDLEGLLESSKNDNSNVVLNISQIIEELLTHELYEVNIADSEDVKLFSDNNKLKIPLISDTVTFQDSKRINEFLEESKINSYTHLDLERLYELLPAENAE